MKTTQKLYFLFFSLLATLSLRAQEDYTSEIVPLWTERPPYNKEEIIVSEQLDKEGKRFSQISDPVIFLYRNTKAAGPGPALLYMPGGGYRVVSIGKSRGKSYARLFFDMGFTTVAVLKYRLPDSSIVTDPKSAPLCDAQKALSMLHKNAAAWNIDRAKIGVKGASAGGHLAACLNNLTDTILVPDVQKAELAQAFSILRAPVISFNEPYRHKGSFRRLLLSEANDPSLLDYYSMENQVGSSTPPTFLVNATDDASVPYENGEIYVQALVDQGIPHKYVQLGRGGHGFGLRRDRVDKDWIAELEKWLHTVIVF